MVKRDGDLNHSLIEGLGPAMNPPPDLFEDVVGSEIAALVDEVDSVLEFGGQGDIVTYCRGQDALETAGRMPALRMPASGRRYETRQMSRVVLARLRCWSEWRGRGIQCGGA